MIRRSDVEGFLLAGGTSRRMGTPKAALLVGDQPIAARVARVLTLCVGRLTVVTNRPSEVAFLGLPTIPDIYPNRGPLGGLHAALAASQTPTIFLAAIDLPFLTDTLVMELLQRHGSFPVTVPKTAEGLHPLCALYDRSLQPVVEKRLMVGRLSMRALVEHVGAEVLDLSRNRSPIDQTALMNINTPEELTAARNLLVR